MVHLHPRFPNNYNGVSKLKLYVKFCRYDIVSACHTQTSRTPSSDNKCDMIGQPHPISNLRPIHFYIPENESILEKKYRIKRQEIQQWNQEFWTRHNTKFITERKEFIAMKGPKDCETPLTADEMSVFYKSFLDRTWKTHFNYNIEWYKKNAQLVILHLKVKVFRAWTQFMGPKKDTKAE